MAGYGLIGSYPTVQVLSPTLVNDVQYCTIQTDPSGVIASMPVQQDVFNKGQAGPVLTAFANGIEQLMAYPHVVAATGTQSLDASGLLQDFVTFTVQYVPTSPTSTSITADADVPVGYLNQSDPMIVEAAIANAEKLVDDAYANLQAAASG